MQDEGCSVKDESDDHRSPVDYHDQILSGTLWFLWQIFDCLIWLSKQVTVVCYVGGVLNSNVVQTPDDNGIDLGERRGAVLFLVGGRSCWCCESMALEPVG